MTRSPELRRTLQKQASSVRNAYPELYEHLRQRDAHLRRLMSRIPSPADIELSATGNMRAHLETIRTSVVSRGIADLEG